MPCVLANHALQDHLISSQLFVFLVFLFLFALHRLYRVLVRSFRREFFKILAVRLPEKFFLERLL